MVEQRVEVWHAGGPAGREGLYGAWRGFCEPHVPKLPTVNQFNGELLEVIRMLCPTPTRGEATEVLSCLDTG